MFGGRNVNDNLIDNEHNIVGSIKLNARMNFLILYIIIKIVTCLCHIIWTDAYTLVYHYRPFYNPNPCKYYKTSPCIIYIYMYMNYLKEKTESYIWDNFLRYENVGLKKKNIQGFLRIFQGSSFKIEHFILNWQKKLMRLVLL